MVTGRLYQRSYIATLSQFETEAPVATVIANGIGIEPVWSRISSGQYRATFTGAAFTAELTHVISIGRTGGQANTGRYNAANSVELQTQSLGSYSDNCLENTLVEIRTYITEETNTVTP